MIKLITNLPIQRKLLLMLLLPSITSLLFAGALLMTVEISEFQKNARDDLATVALLVGNRSVAALMFGDKALADENLKSLEALPTVQVACLYNAQHQLFTHLTTNPQNTWQCPVTIEAKGFNTRLVQHHLCVVQPITVDKEFQGTLYIHADLTAAYWQRIEFTEVLLLILVCTSVFAFFLSTPLLRFITTPLKQLMTTVKLIDKSQDYSLRAAKVHEDELGVLVNAFNGLIETVQRQNHALTRAKNHYVALYDDNPTMIFNIQFNGVILSLNRTAVSELNIKHLDLNDCMVFDFIHPLDLPLMKVFMANCLAAPTQVHNQELRQISYSGRIIWTKITAKAILMGQQDYSLLMVCENVTETRELNEKIAHQASHDALTGLANRSEFDRHIKQLISFSKSNNSAHALCYLDLDQFKVINDTCGHLAGDELLRQLGDVLRKCIRDNDLVARLGGDEFGILMYHCSLLDATAACEQLRDSINDWQFAWEDRCFSIGVSIGVTVIDGNSSNAIHLLKEADAACYAAKDKGRNRVHVFRQDDEQLLRRHGEMQWVARIQQGLDENSFCLYGQLIVPLFGEEGLHFETLVRYQSDRNSPIIPPGAFLPAAERYNLAPALDRWVISHLFQWLAINPVFLEQLGLCSINLSGLSLCDETMLEFISQQFILWRIPKEKICFEITETATIGNLSMANKFIAQLKKQGCKFSLDDFGSGLSSFAYLKTLPVDYLKIDGLFIKNILNDSVDKAMVRSINEIGHIMGKKTIAEFVENEAIFQLLGEMGIDYAQGYGISEPVPLEQLLHLRYPLAKIKK